MAYFYPTCLHIHIGVLVLKLCYRTPFVLGTSLPPVLSIAWRMAIANALNADSALSCIISNMEMGFEHKSYRW